MAQLKNYEHHLIALKALYKFGLGCDYIGIRFNRGKDQNVTDRAPSLIRSITLRCIWGLNAFTDRVGLKRLKMKLFMRYRLISTLIRSYTNDQVISN